MRGGWALVLVVDIKRQALIGLLDFMKDAYLDTSHRLILLLKTFQDNVGDKTQPLLIPVESHRTHPNPDRTTSVFGQS